MTRDACALHTGDRIHIQPHDVYSNHIERDEWVTLTRDPIAHGAIVVINGLRDDGTWFATCYLLLQQVELEVAA
jgi:hypothetical protein